MKMMAVARGLYGGAASGITSGAAPNSLRIDAHKKIVSKGSPFFKAVRQGFVAIIIEKAMKKRRGEAL